MYTRMTMAFTPRRPSDPAERLASLEAITRLRAALAPDHSDRPQCVHQETEFCGQCHTIVRGHVVCLSCAHGEHETRGAGCCTCPCHGGR